MKFSYLDEVYVIPSDMRGIITRVTPGDEFPYAVTFVIDGEYREEESTGDFKEEELHK